MNRYNERGQSLKLGSNIKMYVRVPIITGRKNAASLKFLSTYEIIRVPHDLQFHKTRCQTQRFVKRLYASVQKLKGS